jgi:hypothetical protein
MVYPICMSRVVAGITEQSHCNPCVSQKATKMGTQCLGYSWATLSLGIINTEAWFSMLGVRGWALD